MRSNYAGSFFLSDSIVNEPLSSNEELKHTVHSSNKQHFHDNSAYVDLHRACHKKDLPRIDFLLRKGIDINAIDEEGNTALHYAVKENYDTVFNFLIERGADINVRNSNGYTPLDYALENGYEDFILNALYVKTSDRIPSEYKNSDVLDQFVKKFILPYPHRLDYLLLSHWSLSKLTVDDHKFKRWVDSENPKFKQKIAIKTLKMSLRMNSQFKQQWLSFLESDAFQLEWNANNTPFHAALNANTPLPILKFLYEYYSFLHPKLLLRNDADQTPISLAQEKNKPIEVIQWLRITSENELSRFTFTEATRKLDVGKLSLSLSAINKLAQQFELSKPTSLQEIDLSGNLLSASLMAPLWIALNRYTDLPLERIDLTNNRLEEGDKESFKTLCNFLKKCPALREVSFNNNKIGEDSPDSRLAFLSMALKGHDSLKKIDLRGTNITDKDLEALLEVLDKTPSLVEVVCDIENKEIKEALKLNKRRSGLLNYPNMDIQIDKNEEFDIGQQIKIVIDRLNKKNVANKEIGKVLDDFTSLFTPRSDIKKELLYKEPKDFSLLLQYQHLALNLRPILDEFLTALQSTEVFVRQKNLEKFQHAFSDLLRVDGLSEKDNLLLVQLDKALYEFTESERKNLVQNRSFIKFSPVRTSDFSFISQKSQQAKYFQNAFIQTMETMWLVAKSESAGLAKKLSGKEQIIKTVEHFAAGFPLIGLIFEGKELIDTAEKFLKYVKEGIHLYEFSHALHGGHSKHSTQEDRFIQSFKGQDHFNSTIKALAKLFIQTHAKPLVRLNESSASQWGVLCAMHLTQILMMGLANQPANNTDKGLPLPHSALIKNLLKALIYIPMKKEVLLENSDGDKFSTEYLMMGMGIKCLDKNEQVVYFDWREIETHIDPSFEDLFGKRGFLSLVDPSYGYRWATQEEVNALNDASRDQPIFELKEFSDKVCFKGALVYAGQKPAEYPLQFPLSFSEMQDKTKKQMLPNVNDPDIEALIQSNNELSYELEELQKKVDQLQEELRQRPTEEDVKRLVLSFMGTSTLKEGSSNHEMNLPYDPTVSSQSDSSDKDFSKTSQMNP